jgi:hypothetical protein
VYYVQQVGRDLEFVAVLFQCHAEDVTVLSCRRLVRVALAYADVTSLISPLPSAQVDRMTSSTGPAIAAPAGDTCLNDVAAGMSVASPASRTNCQA